MTEALNAIRDHTLRAIGEIAVASSQLEMMAGALFAQLLHSDDAELVALGQNWATVYQSCQAIVAASAQTESTAKLKQALSTANELYAARSNVIHGHWMAGVAPPMTVRGEPTADQGVSFTLRLKRFGQRTVNTWTSETLERLAVDLTASVRELSAVGALVCLERQSARQAAEITNQ